MDSPAASRAPKKTEASGGSPLGSWTDAAGCPAPGGWGNPERDGGHEPGSQELAQPMVEISGGSERGSAACRVGRWANVSPPLRNGW